VETQRKHVDTMPAPEMESEVRCSAESAERTLNQRLRANWQHLPIAYACTAKCTDPCVACVKLPVSQLPCVSQVPLRM